MSSPKTKKPTYYQQIHSAQRNLTICKRVHRTVKAVIGYYLSRTNHRHQLAWPTQTTIANDLGISLKTVRRAFAAALEVQSLEVVFHSIREARQAEVPVRARHDQRINFVRPLLAWEGFTQRAIPHDEAELILRHLRGLTGIKKDRIVRADSPVNVDRTSRVMVDRTSRVKVDQQNKTNVFKGNKFLPDGRNSQSEHFLESENNGHQQGLGGAYPRDAGRSAPPLEVRLPRPAVSLPSREAPGLADLSEADPPRQAAPRPTENTVPDKHFNRFVELWNRFNPDRVIKGPLYLDLYVYWMADSEYDGPGHRPICKHYRDLIDRLNCSDYLFNEAKDPDGFRLAPTSLFRIKQDGRYREFRPDEDYLPLWHKILDRKLYFPFRAPLYKRIQHTVYSCANMSEPDTLLSFLDVRPGERATAMEYAQKLIAERDAARAQQVLPVNDVRTQIQALQSANDKVDVEHALRDLLMTIIQSNHIDPETAVAIGDAVKPHRAHDVARKILRSLG